MRKTPKTSDKAVVLLSGGIDSAVTLYLVLKYGFRAFVLIFDYRQRHKKEISYAVRNAKNLAVPFEVIRISLPWGGSALTDRSIQIPEKQARKAIPVTYVPARNIIFLSFSVSFAEAIGAEKIFIGAHIQDYSGYPDCRPDFLTSFQNAANLGIKNKGIEIVAPLLKKRKSEIIELGLSLGVDFRNTWSCYRGGRTPCGKCDSCRYRLQGFAQAKVKDPLLSRENENYRESETNFR
ncbi:MAG: 7-cyano-7-deazaguanine synthase QueC [Candidatus Omnitrophica bacterium]|nr:7-cyano-7-deazaguanine synthase QueC [Candidatus Omnitrophota bacterium]